MVLLLIIYSSQMLLQLVLSGSRSYLQPETEMVVLKGEEHLGRSIFYLSSCLNSNQSQSQQAQGCHFQQWEHFELFVSSTTIERISSSLKSNNVSFPVMRPCVKTSPHNELNGFHFLLVIQSHS